MKTFLRGTMVSLRQEFLNIASELIKAFSEHKVSRNKEAVALSLYEPVLWPCFLLISLL